jgi:hypothetical protein
MPDPAAVGFAPEAHITAWRRLMRGAADRRQRGAVVGPVEAGSRHLRSAPPCAFSLISAMPARVTISPSMRAYRNAECPRWGFEGRGRWTN